MFSAYGGKGSGWMCSVRMRPGFCRTSIKLADCLNQTWSSQDLSLGLETSRDSFLQVLVSVLVLEPSSLGLGLSLGTSESWSWSWNPRVSVSVLVLGLGQWRVQRAASIAKKFCLPVTSAPVERIFSHSGLLRRANMARMGGNVLSQLVYLRCNNKL